MTSSDIQTGSPGADGEAGQKGDQGEEGPTGPRGRRGFVGTARFGFAMSGLLFLILFYGQALSQRSAALKLCERSNVARVSELEQRQFLVTANVGRVKATTGAEREANLFALKKYRENRDDLIQSQESVAVAPGENSADGVTVICDDVYPKPWPVNWLP